jgi:hypothetical protein
MNEKTTTIYIFLAILAAIFVLDLICDINDKASIRDYRDTISRMETENRELADRLGRVQTAVDSVGKSIAGSAVEAGSIADGISGVIEGIGDGIRILDELIRFLGDIEEIVSFPGTEIP